MGTDNMTKLQIRLEDTKEIIASFHIPESKSAAANLAHLRVFALNKFAEAVRVDARACLNAVREVSPRLSEEEARAMTTSAIVDSLDHVQLVRFVSLLGVAIGTGKKGFDYEAALRKSFDSLAIPEEDAWELLELTDPGNEKLLKEDPLIELVTSAHFTAGLIKGRSEGKARAPRRVFATTLAEDIRAALSGFLAGTGLSSAAETLHEALKERYRDEEEEGEPGETESGESGNAPRHPGKAVSHAFTSRHTLPSTTIWQRVMDYFAPGRHFTIDEARGWMDGDGYKKTSVATAISGLVRYGYLERTGRGAYLFKHSVPPEEVPLRRLRMHPAAVVEAPPPALSTERIKAVAALLPRIKALGEAYGREGVKAIIEAHAPALSELKQEDVPKVRADLDAFEQRKKAEDPLLTEVLEGAKLSGFTQQETLDAKRGVEYVRVEAALFKHYREGMVFSVNQAKRWTSQNNRKRMLESLYYLEDRGYLAKMKPTRGHTNEDSFIFRKPLPSDWSV